MYIKNNLRTKYENEIVADDLSSREIQFDFTRKSVCYKDVSGNLQYNFYMVSDDTTSSQNNWSASKIQDVVDNTLLHIDIDWISENIIGIYDSPSEIVEIISDGDIFRAGTDASGGWSNNKIYEYDTTWIDLTPTLNDGMTCYVRSTKKSYIFSNNDWVEIGFNTSLYENKNSIMLSPNSMIHTILEG